MRTARARQNRVAWTDFELLAVDRHHATTAEDVVDLVLPLHVISDRRPRLEGTLAEHQLQVRCFAEERIADGLAAAVMRPRLVPGHLFIAFEHIAARFFR